jgi:fucose permease
VSRRASLVLLGLSALGFVGLGLPDGVLGVAWPSIRATYGLPLDALGLLLVSSTAGYVASSFAAGLVMARMTVGALLALSCLVTAGSLLGYAAAPGWLPMVALGALAGLGAGAIDAAINAYAATWHSTRALGVLHACYGVGTTLGPIVMTSLLTAGHSWRRGYLVIGLAQLALAGCFAVTLGRWPRAHLEPGAAVGTALTSTLRLRAAQLGVATFFLYVGLEVIVGAWAFSLLRDARGASTALAGAAVSGFWAGLTTGRLALALAPRSLVPSRIVGPCVVACGLAAGVLALDVGLAASVVAIALLGLAAGPIFPALMASTPARMRAAHVGNAVGFQVAGAAVGQSIVPGLVGVVAEARGLEAVPLSVVAVSAALWLAYTALERAASVRAADVTGVAA